jgi:hypothetical protein
LDTKLKVFYFFYLRERERMKMYWIRGLMFGSFCLLCVVCSNW